MPTAYLVYNPTAGRLGIRRANIEKAAVLLQQQGWETQLRATQSAAHITALAQEAARRGVDAFFVAGGDGSINLAVAGLVGSATALGVLPAGTANVLARDLGLPTPSLARRAVIEESVRLLARAPVYRADVGTCNDRPFLMWAGVGLDAMVVNEVEPRARWEKPFTFPKYVLVALKNTASWSGLHLEVEADGRRIEGNFVLAVATNIRRYAGGVTEISPNAYLDDGVLDLWLFYADNVAEIAQRVVEVLTRKHLASESIKCIPFRQAEIRSERPVLMHTDGEPNGGAPHIRLGLRPQALHLLVPPKGQALFRHPPLRQF